MSIEDCIKHLQTLSTESTADKIRIKDLENRLAEKQRKYDDLVTSISKLITVEKKKRPKLQASELSTLVSTNPDLLKNLQSILAHGRIVYLHSDDKEIIIYHGDFGTNVMSSTSPEIQVFTLHSFVEDIVKDLMAQGCSHLIISRNTDTIEFLKKRLSS